MQQVADDIFKNPYRDGGYDFIPLFQQIDGLVFDSYKEELDQVVSKPKEYNRFELKRQNGQVNAIASRRIDFAAAFGKTFALGPSDTDGYLYAAVKPDFELYGQPTGKLAHLLALMDIRRIYESINNGLLRIRKKPEKDTDGDIKPLRP